MASRAGGGRLTGAEITRPASSLLLLVRTRPVPFTTAREALIGTLINGALVESEPNIWRPQEAASPKVAFLAQRKWAPINIRCTRAN